MDSKDLNCRNLAKFHIWKCLRMALETFVNGKSKINFANAFNVY